MQTNYKYFIGIDVGTNTGLCVWSTFDKKFRQLVTVKIHVAMKNVEYWHKTNPGAVKIRVEDPRKATFGRALEGFKAQGAGSVKRDASIWEDFLSDIGADFEMVRPSKAMTKWTAETFKKVTGYTGATNEHNRDAATLVFGL